MFSNSCSIPLLQSLTVLLILLFSALPMSAHGDSGRKIVEKKCATCHARPDPRNLTAEMWVESMQTMAPLSKLNAQEKEASLKYLQDNSSTLDELIAREKPFYVEKCSKCHSLEEVPSTEMEGSELEDFLSEHLEDKGGGMDSKQAHEIAEFLLHTKIIKK